MLVTELEMLMLDNEVQPEKAPPPIWVTELGIVMLVSEIQPEKTPPPTE